MTLQQQKVAVAVIAFLGMVFLLIVWLMQDKEPKYYGHSLRNAQEADAVAGHPMVRDPEAEEPEFWTAEFEPKLHLFREVERLQIPVASAFENPLGDFVQVEEKENGAVIFNSPAGGIVGAGDPIFATATGMVVLADGAKKTLVLAHRLKDGRLITSLYRGMKTMTVRVNEIVPRGQKIGTLEATDGLTFELCETGGVSLSGVGDRLKVIQFLGEHAPLSRWPEVRVKEDKEQGLQLDAKSAEKLGRFLGKEEE